MLTDWDDDSVEKFSIKAPWALDISPDRKSVVYSKSRETPKKLYLDREDRESPILELSMAWGEASDAPIEVHWMRDDGGEALILANRSIYWASLSGPRVASRIVEDARSLSVSKGQLLYLPRESPGAVVRCALAETQCRDPRRFDVGMKLDQVVWSGAPEQALVLTLETEADHYDEIALLDLRSGKVQALEFPPDLAWILGVHPVPGTTTVILEEGGRTELLDGATQIRFYLWDYVSHRTILFYEDCWGKVLFRHHL